MLDNYPPGAANDPRAPWNESLTREVTVEISVELGTMVTVEAIEDDVEDLRDQLQQAITQKFNVDGKDIVLNDYFVHSIQ